MHVRNGPYKDDLARVMDVDFSGGKAVVRVVPPVGLTSLVVEAILRAAAAAGHMIARTTPAVGAYSA